MSGLLVIISSPSGGGKDSVIRALLKTIPHSVRMVTTTSRPPRPKNTNGVDYFFITKEEFEKKIKNGDFLEYNFYAGNYYGTEKKTLEKLQSSYEIIFTQIEVNGKHNLDKADIHNLSIFLLPDNLEILRKRIERRGGIKPEIIKERLETAKKEISAASDYDHLLVNEDGKFDQTVAKITEIIRDALDKRPNIDKNEDIG